LMWGLAEYRLELPDQMKRRNLDFPCEIRDGERRLPHLEQQIARQAQTTESFVSQEHDFKCSWVAGWLGGWVVKRGQDQLPSYRMTQLPCDPTTQLPRGFSTP
jgi:hypothetical protein